MVSVYTVGDLCKKCYSCVRECPTKAIEVHAGQADIIESLCISCGRCVLTCTQNAKRIRSSTAAVQGLLTERQAGGRPVYALLAPSFPAAFLDVEPERLVGAIRALGFDGVFEVAFGADLVSYEYYRRFRELEREVAETPRTIRKTLSMWNSLRVASAVGPTNTWLLFTP